MKTSIKVLTIATLAIASIAYGAYDLSTVERPRELINYIGKTGISVSRDGVYDDYKYPVDLGMDLKLDYVGGFTAMRFPSNGLASAYCEIRSACVHVNHWVLWSDLNTKEQQDVWVKLNANTRFQY